jgi:predicted metal-dependent peptidase
LAGKISAGATRSLEASKAANVDWRELLCRVWSEMIPSDYSWTHPNRRQIWNGLYLPGVTSEGVSEVAIAVYCSGSIHARQLGLFEAEVRSTLAGHQPRLVHVLYFDAEYTITRRVRLASQFVSLQSAAVARISVRASGGWKRRDFTHENGRF